MIKLFGFGPHFGVRDPSPFVLKVDVYFRMMNLPFEVHNGAEYLREAPKGKLPFIEDEGERIADSSFIIRHVEAKTGRSLDEHLSPNQRALSDLLSKSIDEHFYWCLVYSRWTQPDTWPLVKDAFFGGLPLPLRVVIPVLAMRDVKSALKHQGIGRHSHEEVMAQAEETLVALSNLLADKPYFFGEEVSNLDATVYALLAQFYSTDMDGELIRLASRFDTLRDYTKRIEARYYSD